MGSRTTPKPTRFKVETHTRESERVMRLAPPHVAPFHISGLIHRATSSAGKTQQNVHAYKGTNERIYEHTFSRRQVHPSWKGALFAKRDPSLHNICARGRGGSSTIPLSPSISSRNANIINVSAHWERITAAGVCMDVCMTAFAEIEVAFRSPPPESK
jgi:hypothetical protein